MEQRLYPAQIEAGPKSFGAWFIDFPGCVSVGDSIAEAIEGAHEALALHVSGMIEDGERIPQPSSPTLEESSVVVAMISVTLPGKAIRINITMDEGLVAAIDRVASNRSRFLADAVRTALATRNGGAQA